MNMTQYTTSKDTTVCKTVAIVTGIVLLAGVTAACTYAWISRRKQLVVDPLQEADRLISELENSFQRLHEAVGT